MRDLLFASMSKTGGKSADFVMREIDSHFKKAE